jgi:glycerophosphoryl diester phosphodiesterase
MKPRNSRRLEIVRLGSFPPGAAGGSPSLIRRRLQFFTMSGPLLLGHRGARATRSVPENTLASFDLALAHGCDGFEFDVRGTADGRALICHDPKIHGVDIALAGPAQLTGLPTLAQVLARYQERAFLDIEVKVSGMEQAVLESLRLHPPRRGYFVSSFLPEVLHTMRALRPDVPLGLLAETSSQLAAWPAVPAEFVLPHDTLIDINVCNQLRSAEKKIVVWTVNSRERMLYCRHLRVDGIISDETELLGRLSAEG